MLQVLLSRLIILVFGTLYPAYASYKTVKTKNVRHYVKWMMYWIVFAVYSFIEVFADIFIAFWFPFYYELKILFVIWLVCPATRGSTYIFTKVIIPQLGKNEEVLDSYIGSLWTEGYEILMRIWAIFLEYFFKLLRQGFTDVGLQNNDIAESNSVIQVPVKKRRHRQNEEAEDLREKN